MSAHKKEQLGFGYTYMLCHNFIAIGKPQWLLVIYLSLRMAFELILASFLLFFFWQQNSQRNKIALSKVPLLSVRKYIIIFFC